MVPRSGTVEFGRSAADAGPREIDPSNLPRFGRLPWAVLLKRVFLVDVLECPKCKGRMKILAAVIAPANVRRVLEGLGLPVEAPRLRPARPPPQTALGNETTWADDFCDVSMRQCEKGTCTDYRPSKQAPQRSKWRLKRLAAWR